MFHLILPAKDYYEDSIQAFKLLRQQHTLRVRDRTFGVLSWCDHLAG